jgi:hypothetical protein
MPGLSLWGIPAVIVVGGVGYFLIRATHQASEFTERERPEPENRPGFFLARVLGRPRLAIEKHGHGRA